MNDQDTSEQAGENSTEESPLPAAQPPEEAPRPPRASRGLYFAVLLALFAAFGAASGAGFLWWEYRQLEAALDQADTASARSLDGVRAAIESLEENVGVLQRSDAAMLEASGGVAGSVEALSARHGALEARVDAFQGVSGDARRRWLRAEAEHYLNVANAELALGGRWENAVTALELADDNLRQLAEPAFAPVRRQISADLLALRRADLVDVEGLSHTLARLADRVDQLPMGPAAPGRLTDEPPRIEDAETGWRRAWLSVLRALSGMIEIERSDASASPALTAREQLLIRRQLVLELELARLGLLRNQTQVFHSSLELAGTLLAEYFDGSEPPVRSAAALIEDMMQLEIDPPRPDIGGSLSLLRGLADRDG